MFRTTITATKVEERWTPAAIQAAFAFELPSLPSCQRSSAAVSVNLPLLHLGTFTLSLTAGRTNNNRRAWTHSMLAFRRQSSTVPWGKTRMRAELSTDVLSGSVLLGTTEVVLADSTPVESRIAASSTLPSSTSITLWLAVTTSECPFDDGFFHAHASHTNEAEALKSLVKNSGDRILSRSLATGKMYDIKFLSYSARPSGNLGEPVGTYASIPVLERHVDLSSAKISERWTNALRALNRCDDAGVNRVEEILSPDGYEYELDSDFEDVEDHDESTSAAECGVLGELETGRQPESGSESSRSSFSSFGVDGASDQSLVDFYPEELVKPSGEPPNLSLETSNDHEPTILVKFAAHKTWLAFLWYCYTGQLEFNKLKSQNEPGVLSLRTVEDQSPPSCSPKSMYRLADLVGDEGLKATALNAIRERMTELNVMEEVFSAFTAKYPDVREVQLNVLMKHCRTAEVKKAFLETMLKLNMMPHAESVLSAFYDKAFGANEASFIF